MDRISQRARHSVKQSSKTLHHQRLSLLPPVQRETVAGGPSRGSRSLPFFNSAYHRPGQLLIKGSLVLATPGDPLSSIAPPRDAPSSPLGGTVAYRVKRDPTPVGSDPKGRSDARLKQSHASQAAGKLRQTSQSYTRPWKRPRQRRQRSWNASAPAMRTRTRGTRKGANLTISPYTAP